MIKNEIIEEIDALCRRYENLFDKDEDPKMLQGMERCIEMKMKASGIDGKNNPESEAQQNPSTIIDLSKIPTSLLKELLEIANKTPDTQS